MRLDATDLRYVTDDEWRVLTAVSIPKFLELIAHRRSVILGAYRMSCSVFKFIQVETGSRNHEVVPTPLIAQLSRITGGQVNKCLGVLARRSLIARVQGNKCGCNDSSFERSSDESHGLLACGNLLFDIS